MVGSRYARQKLVTDPNLENGTGNEVKKNPIGGFRKDE
jgi:hypothetical protein